MKNIVNTTSLFIDIVRIKLLFISPYRIKKFLSIQIQKTIIAKKIFTSISKWPHLICLNNIHALYCEIKADKSLARYE